MEPKKLDEVVEKEGRSGGDAISRGQMAIQKILGLMEKNAESDKKDPEGEESQEHEEYEERRSKFGDKIKNKFRELGAILN